MTATLLEVADLAVAYPTADGLLWALRGVSLAVAPGEALGIVGESGCGKSTLAYALLGDLGRARISGAVRLDGRDFARMTRAELRAVRGRRVAMVPQDPGAALNPARRVGDQLREVLAAHGGGTPGRIAALLERVHLSDPAALMRRWPHQLSGGQQQRVVIAMALLGDPGLLVLDEPTTGLDATVEAAVLDLLAELRRDLGVAMVLISHNLGVIARVCDRAAVLYAGRVAEIGPVSGMFTTPRHPYTRALLDCVPRADRPRDARPAPPIAGELPSPFAPAAGCAFADRCPRAIAACRDAPPPLLAIARDHDVACPRWADPPPPPVATAPPPAATPAGGEVLRVERLGVVYGKTARAVDDVSFALGAGRITAIVGESGSGKSSLASAIAGLRPANQGDIFLGSDLMPLRLRRRPRWTRRALQMVFQDHGSTLNPELAAGRGIARAVRLLEGRSGVARRTADLMRAVGLDPSVARRRPGSLSGGQRQRVAIARAFAGHPRVVICDEITSALDVSVQAQVLAFLRDLRHAHGASLLFITHDLGVVRQIADEILVMHRGAICESGPTEAVFAGPNHPYTAILLGSVTDPGRRRTTPVPRPGPGEARARGGCVFAPDCPRRPGPLCDGTPPPWREPTPGHRIRCHLEPAP